MIEIVRAKAPKARQPWHVRVVAEGNSEPLLHGEQLTDESKAHVELEALGRLFSPVDTATYTHSQGGGVLHVWLEEDEHGEKLSVPVAYVDEREPEQPRAEPAEVEPEKAPAAKKASKKR